MKVFRWVPRDRRPEYVRRMKGTFAVAARDLDRALRVATREFVKAFPRV